jgi:dodecin
VIGFFSSSEEERMPERTYKLIELVGVSETSTDEAIRNAIARASQTLKGLDWFEVTEVRGLLHEGTIRQFQVTLKVGFHIMGEDELKGA